MKLDLAITGMGICSTLGFQADRVCAALFAGLERPVTLPGTEVDDPTEIVATAVGHRIEGFSDGFIQTGRWIRLAEQCLAGFAESLNIDREKAAPIWTRTAVLPSVPYAFDEHRLDWSADQALDVASESFMGVLQGVSGFPFQFEPSYVRFGHAGVCSALEQAHALLASARFDRVIVLGVDSYVELLSLLSISESGRIKTPGNPIGLVPGEACACFSVERISHAARSTGAGAVRVLAANCRYDSSALTPIYDDPPPSIAENLRQVVQQTLDEGCGGAPFRGEVVLDQNGETWKANAWGNAYARLCQLPGFRPSRLIVPASSVGETGAASAALGVCLAAHVFARGFAKENKMLIVSIAENGDVGAILVGTSP